MISLAYSSKLGEEIGCMEVTPLGVSKITIRGITEVTILSRKKLCDEYSPLGIYEWISEGVKEVALLGLIEISMLGLTNPYKLGEDMVCKEDALIAVLL